MKIRINIKILLTVIILLISSLGTTVPVTKAANKIYHVPVQLWHAENSGRLSMGNGAISSIAQVEETSGGSIITVEFIPMQFMNMNGHLYSLAVYNGSLFSGGISRASVISTYQDTDLDGNIANFPALLQFTRSVQKEDKIGVQVSVDAMDKVMGGDASQNAILKFSWNNATLISGESESQDIKPEQSNEDNLKNEESMAPNEKEQSEKKAEVTEEKIPQGQVKKVEDFFNIGNKTKEVGTYTLDITAAYLNPLTGVTADGGTKNIDIGEGMSQGVISPVNASGNLEEALANQKNTGAKRWSKAQLQRTKDGKLYATVRIHLMNWVTRSAEQGPFIKVLQKDGDYQLVEAKETQVHIEQYKDSYADYQFEVPNENFSAMIQMFVEPMNRPVRFFVEVNPDTIAKGTVEGMTVIEEKIGNKKIMYGSILLLVVGGITINYFSNKRRKQGE